MTGNRKIEAMHSLFGLKPDCRCEDCSNLIKGYCGKTFVRKCTAYGATHSAASDWRKKYVACGIFNQEYAGRPVIELLKSSPRKAEVIAPIEGQEVLYE